jgi:diacylglycerol O-acyltransferase / wax synthase
MAEAARSSRLSTQDASFLYNETLTGPLHIGFLQTFEGEIDFADLTEYLRRRIHLLPRFRQRLVPVPMNLAHATLEDDPQFDITQHLERHPLKEGSSDAEMSEAAMRANQAPLSRHRPLWQLHLFQGLEGGRSAVLWKIHHSIVDGVSALQLMALAMDLKPDAPSRAPEQQSWSPAPLPDSSRSLLDAAAALVAHRIEEMREVARLLGSPSDLFERNAAMAAAVMQMTQLMSRPIVAAPWNLGLVSAERSFAWLGVSFSDIRTIRTALGGTVNDVVLAILAEGAARYLDHNRIATAGLPLRIGCPVNVRRATEARAMGNRVSMMFVESPAAPMPLTERYQAIVQETLRIKAAREPQGMDLLTATADSISPSLLNLSATMQNAAIETATLMSELAGGTARMFAGTPMGINFIATNVPGAQVPMYLAGHRMLEFMGIVPLAGTLGYGVAIVSYSQKLFFGLVAEPRMMPDMDFMKSCVGSAFAELHTAANAAHTNERPVQAAKEADTRDPAVAL